MNYEPYPPFAMRALEGRPAYNLECSLQRNAVDFRIAGESVRKVGAPDTNHLRGYVFSDEPAELTRFDADGNGRGTYLAAAFIREAYIRGAAEVTAYAVHPGTLKILGNLLGAEALVLQTSYQQSQTAFDGDFDAALKQLHERQIALAESGTTAIPAITIGASLLDETVQLHLFGDELPPKSPADTPSADVWATALR